MCVIIKKSMQTENRQTPLHAVHAPLRIYRPTHVNRNDELMEEGDALVSAFVANLPKLMTSPPNIVIAVVVARHFCPRCRRRCIRLRSDTVPHMKAE